LTRITSDGGISDELLNSVKKRKNDIKELIEKVTKQIPQNSSCFSIVK
jgi:hypothetical protein